MARDGASESMDRHLHVTFCGYFDGFTPADNITQGFAHTPPLFVAGNGGSSVGGGVYGLQFLDDRRGSRFHLHIDGAADMLAFSASQGIV